MPFTKPIATSSTLDVAAVVPWIGALAFVMLAALPSSSAAQLCGDADGNGAIAVTDGVNVLRDVAGLASTCSNDPTRCDVDGSGGVTVTDGVNVLRHTAGLAATLACLGPSTGVARFAGRYEGTYSGDDRGDFDVEIHCDGEIEGVAFSNIFDEGEDVFGTATDDGDVTITTGGTSSAATFSGTIDDDGRVSGTWSNRFDGSNGSFRGSRTSARSCD